MVVIVVGFSGGGVGDVGDVGDAQAGGWLLAWA
jgi:hypothetical protein